MKPLELIKALEDNYHGELELSDTKHRTASFTITKLEGLWEEDSQVPEVKILTENEYTLGIDGIDTFVFKLEVSEEEFFLLKNYLQDEYVEE